MDLDTTFLELTFTGGRFTRHDAPVEMLREFVRFQDLIAAVARALFLDNNPSRRNVPAGFSDATRLYLRGTRDNCFTAVLSRREIDIGPPTLFCPDLLCAALAESIAAIRAVNDNGVLPLSFPKSAYKSLAALGSQLEDDESLGVRGALAQNATITPQLRAKIASLVHVPLSREETVDGEVEQVSDHTQFFSVRVRAHAGAKVGRYEVPFALATREAALDAQKAAPAVRARVCGVVVEGNNRMTDVSSVEFYEHERAPLIAKASDRIDALAKLTDGWLDGGGASPTKVAVESAKRAVARVLADGDSFERPGIFPTPDGGIQAEWLIGDWAVDAKFDGDTGQVTAEATNAATGEELDPVVAESDCAGPELLNLLLQLP